MQNNDPTPAQYLPYLCNFFSFTIFLGSLFFFFFFCRIIDEFLENKTAMFADTTDHYHNTNDGDAAIAFDEEAWKEEMDNIRKEFDSVTNKTWHTVMENEIQLFEIVEEANTQFGLVILELLNEFIEQAQTYFVQIREAEGNFSDAILDTVSRFITEKGQAGEIDDIPDALKEVYNFTEWLDLGK